MKKLILGVAALCLAGCLAERPAQTQTATPTPAATTTPNELPATSLYQLPSQWQDRSGKTHRLTDLRGKVQVLAMIYTSCEGVCPEIVHRMQVIQQRVHDDRVGFVAVSFDPEDDPAALQQYVLDHHLDQHWNVWRGSAEDVRELSATLNFKYSKTGKRDFAHSNMLTVLDRDGVIVKQQTELGTDSKPVLEAVQGQLK